MSERLLLGTLHSPRYKVVKAIPVKIEHGIGDEWIASTGAMFNHEWGIGETSDRALRDLGKSLIDLYECLTEEGVQLGPYLERVRRNLVKHVQWKGGGS